MLEKTNQIVDLEDGESDLTGDVLSPGYCGGLSGSDMTPSP